MSHRYHNPVAIRFGAGSLAELPEVLAGRRTVLVTFPEAEALGLVARLRGDPRRRRSLGVDGPHRAQPRRELTSPRCTSASGATTPSARPCVAVGGGSAIDTAKALMVGTESGRFDELHRAARHRRSHSSRTAPKALIAVPTTAGTGSEVTPWATIWDKAAGKKHSLHLPRDLARSGR